MTDTHVSQDLERLIAEEPFVRSLARSLVAGEADDVVQQTYLLAVEKRPGPIRSPRLWLSRILRNVVRDRWRESRRRTARESHRAAAAHPVPSSAELFEREERRRELLSAVDALPENLRAVVLLRYFENLPPRQIARELGLPVATVWNRLRSGLALLRKRLDAEHGSRRAWLGLLGPVVAEGTVPTLGAGGTITAGVLAMSTKVALAVVGIVAAAAFAFWISRPSPEVPAVPLTASPGDARAERAELGREVVREAVPSSAPRVVAGSGTEAASTGSLEVRAIYAEDGSAANGVLVSFGFEGNEDPVFGSRMLHTDAAGLARVEGIEPGNVTIGAEGRNGSRTVEVAAGRETGTVLEIQAGMTLTGEVVDETGRGVPGASVHLGYIGIARPVRELAKADEFGRFSLRAVMARGLVGARAEGYAASPLYLVNGTEGGVEELRIVLSEDGGVVTGQVLGPDFEPIAGAVVSVGSNERNFRAYELPDGSPVVKTDAARAVTDEDGWFTALGLAPGEQPVEVRAESLGAWVGTVRVDPRGVTIVDIALEEGAAVVGMFRDQQGSPATGLAVQVGTWNSLLHYRARTGADGSYRLDGLPPGEITVVADAGDRGEAMSTFRAAPGETLRWDATLFLGVTLRGRVVQGEEGVMGAAVIASAPEGNGFEAWSDGVFTNADGSFVITGCPPGRLLTVKLDTGQEPGVTLENVDPVKGEITLRIPRTP